MNAEQRIIKEALEDFDMASNIIAGARAKLLTIYAPPEKTDHEKSLDRMLQKVLKQQERTRNGK